MNKRAISRPAAGAIHRPASTATSAAPLRPAAAAGSASSTLQRLKQVAHNSPQAMQLQEFGEMMAGGVRAPSWTAQPDRDDHDGGPPVQGRFGDEGSLPAATLVKQGSPLNHTGMPNQLKAGIESLSGIDLSDVRVRRNSDKPAQLNALAYAQGNEIHLGPGQEQHLPHEAWHVVQQAQGRVPATGQLAGASVNDDLRLEAEADLMGAAAIAQGAGMDFKSGEPTAYAVSTAAPGPVQRRRLSLLPGQSRQGGVLQRALAPFQQPAAPTANQLLLAHDAGLIDQATDVAYSNTVDRLLDVDNLLLTDFPGVSQDRFAHFVTTLGRNSNALKAAATGYIIEDQVTHAVGGVASIRAQVNAGGAIPDFVITRGPPGAVERAIVDVTSEDQLGHVLGKNFNPAGYTWIWESIYTTVDFSNIVAPVLAGVTLQQVQQARRRRADESLRAELYQLNRAIDLQRTGVAHGVDGWAQNAGVVKTQVLAITGQADGAPLTAGTITALDQAITHMNTALNAALPPGQQNDFAASSFTAMIQRIRAKYGTQGNPWW